MLKHLFIFLFFGLGIFFSFDKKMNSISSRTPASENFEVGFNIAWVGENYGHQWTKRSFSPQEIKKDLDLAQKAKASLVRIWLFEGKKFEQFKLNKQGLPVELKTEFIPNIIFFLSEAKKRNLKVNLTLFDSNAFEDEFARQTTRSIWWHNFFNQKYDVTKTFFDDMLHPLFNSIKKNNLSQTVSQVELVNEIDGLVKLNAFDNDWENVEALMCQTHEWFKERNFAYGASVGHFKAYKLIIDQKISSACVDYYDLHLYNDEGSIPNCQDFLALEAQGIKLQLGEFGQKTASADLNIQATISYNFLTNAKKCGFKSALGWKLDDIRKRADIENYLSFVNKDNSPRPAFYVMKKFSENN